MSEPQTFRDIITEWTNECVKENKTATTAAEIALIMRLGTLGQQLIYDAANSGMDRTIEILKEQRNAAGAN